MACGASNSDPAMVTDAAPSDLSTPADLLSPGDLSSTPDLLPPGGPDLRPADCPPCAPSYQCIEVGKGLTTTLNGTPQPDGSCKLAGLTLKCGGTGTDATGGSLTWSVPSGTLVISLSIGVLNCN
jgi:hypothetical protein